MSGASVREMKGKEMINLTTPTEAMQGKLSWRVKKQRPYVLDIFIRFDGERLQLSRVLGLALTSQKTIEVVKGCLLKCTQW